MDWTGPALPKVFVDATIFDNDDHQIRSGQMDAWKNSQATPGKKGRTSSKMKQFDDMQNTANLKSVWSPRMEDAKIDKLLGADYKKLNKPLESPVNATKDQLRGMK